jgi:hypothetical protein
MRKGVRDSKAVAILREAVAADRAANLAAIHTLMLEPPRTDKQLKVSYVVALVESILLLLKEDTRDLEGSESNEDGRGNAAHRATTAHY